jgi:glutamate carboxypeptidase
MIDDLRRIVTAESPSNDMALLETCCDLLAEIGESWLGAAPEMVRNEGLPNLLWRFGSRIEVLLLCHYDTVWPAGTIDRWPFDVRGDVMTGPGVFDMKAGIVQAFAAVASLPERDGVAILLTGDEELGSPRSREIIERYAAGAQAVLVLESSVDGELKTSRKGASFWTATFTGRAAHAGLEPEKGASAITAASHWILRAQELADSAQGTSVVVTTLQAGTAANVVPAIAVARIDSRAAAVAEQERVDRELREIPSEVAGVEVRIDGGINRPPLEDRMSRPLKERLDQVRTRAGLEPIAGRAVGGGSDGNLTAAIGIPTLDGFGAVGAGAHAEGEWASISGLYERTDAVGALIADLLASPLPARTH